MTTTIARIAGINYIIIFVCAVFANFFVLELVLSDPLGALASHAFLVRLGTVAFLITAVCDVIVAWALYVLFKEHVLSTLSTFFRVLHAGIMGVAVFALVALFSATTADGILAHAQTFTTIWLIGLFFFGFHLIILSRIMQRPKWIMTFILLAGCMYIIDTVAHFTLANYSAYKDIFLALVAIPSIFGEMALAVWLLRGKVGR